jgi:nucleoside-diphosphate-sugar epimerase
VFHLASPASPVDFERIPEEIYQVNGFGTHYLATWATSIKARFLFASTSEAYGDPLVHPQVETYTGNVNPVGPRACYDESKRFGEMVTMNAVRKHDLDGRIVRIFNTYGPRMRVDDGRVMPEFISQALRGDALSIHGNGEQTRSYCYVDDLVEYILRAMAYEEARGEVINIGNTEELSVIELAEKIIGTVGSTSTLNYVAARPDDPHRRQPDLAKAKQLLGFEPGINLDNGLGKTIEWFLK